MPKKQTDQQYDNAAEPKKIHSLISPKKKEKLIELVVLKKFSIYKAAKRLQICHPTAKFIMKNYRKNIAVREENANPRLPNVQCKKEKVEESEGNYLKISESVEEKRENNQQLLHQHHSRGVVYPFLSFWPSIYPYHYMPFMPNDR